MRDSRVLLSLAAIYLSPALAACASDDGGGAAADAAAADARANPDARAGCEPTAALPYEWRPIDTVSGGAIGAPSAGTLSVDATAGGLTDAAEQPYVYLAFGAGGPEKVDISDVASYAESAWHLALKRQVIRVNGGDSGPGGVRSAAVPAAALADVTQAPLEAGFASDDWATDTCEIVTGALGEPLAAMGEWYDYDANTHHITPRALVYVLDLGDGRRVKLRIATYYGDAANPMRGAHYRVEWGML